MPTSKTNPEHIKARKKLWSTMDMNGNGLCSLAEIDKGIRDGIGISDLFDAKPAIIRAFNFAKDYCPGKPG
jgi:hypothetical protein